MDFLSPSLPLIKSLQLPWLRAPSLALSALGSEPFLLFLVALLFWGVNRQLGARLGFLLLISFLVNDVLKVGFALPRPYWSGEILPWSNDSGFGLPSGHATAAIVVWPFLALHSQNPRKWLPLALLLTLGISLSRLVLGAHYPADVMAGWLTGALLLGAWFRTHAQLEEWWHRANWNSQVVLALAIVAVYALSHALSLGNLVSKVNSELFAKAANEARSFEEVAARGGALFGLLLGFASAPRFEAQTTIKPLIGRLLIALIGLVAIYVGLKMLVPDEFPFRFARYAFTTFWIVCGAPWVWERIGLAREETRV